MRAAWITLLLAGCGRIGFGGEERARDAPQLDTNRAIDAPPVDAFVFLDSPPSLDAFPGLTTGFDDPSFLSCPADLVLLGDAHCTEGALQLTANVADQKGVVWTKDPFAITATTRFAMHLLVRITTSQPGDGMAIVIQNSPAGNTASGTGGGYLAIDQISPSLALEIDTYSNPVFGDPDGDHLGFDRDGELTSIATAAPAFVFHEGNEFNLWLDYDGPTTTWSAYTTLDVSKPTVPTLTVHDDLTRLGPTAYIGITGTTGGSFQQNRVLAWRLDVL